MLLLNMSHSEVYNEIFRDLRNVERYEQHLRNSFRRMSLKMRNFPKFIFTEYVSPRKNNWIISTKFYGKNDFSSTFGVLQVQNGLVLHQVFVNAILDKFTTLCTFIPHFFERYAQHNQLTSKGKELIKQLLRDDCSFNIDKTREVSGRKERDKENNVHACMCHGVGLGYEVGKRHYLMKTYITYEMTRGRQKQVLESKREDIVTTAERVLGKPPKLAVKKDLVADEETIKKIKRKLNK